ncbi:MAG: GDP-L-fucose synthase, partial [Burkholderiales bacterium]
AEACVRLMGLARSEWDARIGLSYVNVGCGEDQTVRELAQAIARVTGFGGALEFDASKPDGTPRKLLDSGRVLSTGWRPRLSLEDGLRATYAWFREHVAARA